LANSLLLFTAQIVSIVSVLLLATGFLKADPGSPSARVFSLMIIFVVFYLLEGMAGPNIAPEFRLDLGNWMLLVQVGVSSVSGLFMLYCFLVFQEKQKFPFAFSVAFALQVLIDAVLLILTLSAAPIADSATINLLAISMDIVQLIFVGLAIYWTLKGWRADMVDDRRVLRWFTIYVQGALIFAVIFVETFLLDIGSTGYAAGQAVIVYATAILTLGMVFVALRFDSVSLSYVIRKVANLTEESEAEGLKTFDIDSFSSVFKEQLLYREAGLTISMLGKKLGIPEYRLRAFIHKQLGFRNFNAMLHRYRIEDASNILSDSENQSLPVLTIALNVGYQSITPFNNDFREIIGTTPSEYRKKTSQS